MYNRPFLQVGKLPVALGGYAEANYQYLQQDGVTEGHQFQMRRVSLFISSSIANRIKFLSEIEFEDGAKEIGIEFASLDIEFNPLLNLRGGIVINPIGAQMGICGQAIIGNTNASGYIQQCRLWVLWEKI
jgi:hypothetical protein